MATHPLSVGVVAGGEIGGVLLNLRVAESDAVAEAARTVRLADSLP
jgi:hypothetical protein